MTGAAVQIAGGVCLVAAAATVSFGLAFLVAGLVCIVFGVALERGS